MTRRIEDSQLPPPIPPMFSTWEIISLVVVGVAAALFAVGAYFQILYPVSLYASIGLGLIVVFYTAIRYCSKEYCGPTDYVDINTNHFIFNPLQQGRIENLPPHDIVQRPQQETWNNYLDQLNPQNANLIDGTEQVAQPSRSGLPQRPLIGTYESQYADLLNCQMVWRLPSSQLQAFPQGIQNAFGQNAQNGTLDLFFLFINDTAVNRHRNVVIHPLVFPEFNIAEYPNSRNGLAIEAEMRIFEPNGIEPYNIHRQAIAMGNQWSRQNVIFHRAENAQENAISPNNARFTIQQSVNHCSFYVAARYRGRACAVYVIIDREPDLRGPLSTQLMISQTLNDLLNNLNGIEYRFPYCENIRRLLRYY